MDPNHNKSNVSYFSTVARGKTRESVLTKKNIKKTKKPINLTIK